ncbi:MAG: hypothetical protein LKI76_06440 [Megasphaera sp.]|jgi:hypothetical protein|uniref:hypothetical protein n=1 Tax=Megasphaera sueciensis TaxID=349094 RepID=UPI002ACB063B|nr:hypothetical protein [Megasphaera sp.]MCI1823553.1 hypothetical protein [Megasphaera sp.]
MKTKCVELSNFERDLVYNFAKQPKDTPIPAALCRAIIRRLEGKPVFAKNRVRISQNSHTHLAAAVSEK